MKAWLLLLSLLPQLHAEPVLRFEQPPAFIESSAYNSTSGIRALGRWAWPRPWQTRQAANLRVAT